MTEALEYYKTFFDDGQSSTALLDAGELESGFADGTFGSFISGPWHTGLVEDAGVSAGPVRRRAAARQGQRARHVVHRWWRPGRLQRLRQQGRRLEVRPVAERARDPAGVLRRGRRPARRASPPGTPASSPTTRSCRSSASSSTAPSPRRPCRRGKRWPRRSTARSRRPPRATPTRLTPCPPCRSRPRRSAPDSDMSLDTKVSSPDRGHQPRSGGGSSPSRHVDPTRRQQARRRVDARAAVHAAVPGVHAGAGAGQLRDELHRHAAGRHPHRRSRSQFVGLDNYVKLIEDPLFRKVTVNTLLYLVLGVPLTMARRSRAWPCSSTGSSGSRASSGSATTCPVVTSIVAVSVVWKYLYRDNGGVFNTMLVWVGLDGPGLARQHRRWRSRR